MATLVLVTILLVFVTWWALLYLMQDSILFPRHAAPRYATAQPPAGTLVLTRGGTASAAGGGAGRGVEAWYCPLPGASPTAPAPLVVFFHGNAEVIDQQADLVARYHALGWSVLLPEYRGYGRSAGHPSQGGIREDARHFVESVLARPEVDGTRLVYHGRSLGGAVAVDLAQHVKPTAIVLQSTFASVNAMARRFYAPGFLIRNPYRTDRVLPTLGVPVLIHHGRRDEIIPFAHAQQLRALLPATNPTLVEFDCTHNDFPGSIEAYEQFWSGIEAFLSSAAASAEK